MWSRGSPRGGLLDESLPGKRATQARARVFRKRASDGSCPRSGLGGEPSKSARPPSAAIAQRERRPRREQKAQVITVERGEVSGPAEIENEGERVPDGFTSNIKQEPAERFVISAPPGAKCKCRLLCVLTSISVRLCSLPPPAQNSTSPSPPKGRSNETACSLFQVLSPTTLAVGSLGMHKLWPIYKQGEKEQGGLFSCVLSPNQVCCEPTQAASTQSPQQNLSAAEHDLLGVCTGSHRLFPHLVCGQE